MIAMRESQKLIVVRGRFADMEKRNVQLKFRVTPSELIHIREKMEQAGIQRKGAYLRKMAMDGYVILFLYLIIHHQIFLQYQPEWEIQKTATHEHHSPNGIVQRDMENYILHKCCE